MTVFLPLQRPNGSKQRPPKSSSKPTTSAQDDIEFEIAEVLYGLLRQPQAPTKQEIVGNDSTKIDSRENHNKSTSDAKSSVSSPISNSQSTVPQSSSIPHSNSSSSAAPTSAIGEFEQMWFHVLPSRPCPSEIVMKMDGKS